MQQASSVRNNEMGQQQQARAFAWAVGQYGFLVDLGWDMQPGHSSRVPYRPPPHCFQVADAPCYKGVSCGGKPRVNENEIIPFWLQNTALINQGLTH
jgi:hypothetical protein